MNTPANPKWARIQDLFDAASQWPSEEWQQRLQTMETDADLRQQVLALLRASQQEHAANAAPESAIAVLPETVGPFRVVRLAGAGGRGRVFLAVRGAPDMEQRVAVKVMHEHLISPEDLHRFEREQRLLLALQHPGIARFLEAGWDAGRPFYAMEWVEGEAIDAYCRSRNLSTPHRVRLVIQVLVALQAAHRNLVAHLDLKPSNVLVDKDGQIRLLDFGTAKLIQDEDDTSTTQMTPRYASPERLRGDRVSAAADIYAVGLLLCELVTGEHPFGQASSIAAMGERAMGRIEPTVDTGSRDLNSIVRKALAFVPEQRYASAAEFSADLQAWLERRPVLARPQSAWYRASRFLTRHPAQASSVFVAVALIVGLAGYAAWQREQRYQEALRGEETSRFLRWMITSSTIPGSGNPAMTVTEMVERGNQRLKETSSLSPDVAASIQADFAFLTQERGREDLAETMARDALQRADEGGSSEVRLKARARLAGLLLRRGQCPAVSELLQTGDALQGRSDVRAAERLGYLLTRAAAAEQCEASPPEALRWMEEALRVGLTLPEESFGLAPAVARAGVYLNYALLLSRAARPQDALAAANQGIELAASHPDGRYFRVALLRIRSQIHAAAGAMAPALEDAREAARLAPGVVNPFEEVRLQTLLAGRMVDAGQHADAAALARRTVDAARQKQAAIGPSFWMILADAAEVLAKADACNETQILYGEVVQLTNGQMPRTWQGNRYFYLAECASKQNPRQAAALARQALDSYGELLPPASKRRVRILELIQGKN